MIPGVVNPDMARRAARRARRCYQVASALWVALLAAWGFWQLVKAIS